MIQSVRLKLFIVFILLLTLFLGIFLITNTYFLDDIFIAGNKQAMNRMYSDFKENILEGYDEEELLRDISNGFGGQVSIIDPSLNIIRSTSFYRKKDPFIYPLSLMKAINYFDERPDENTYFTVTSLFHRKLEFIVFVGKLPGNQFFIAEKALGMIEESSRMAERFIIISGIGTLILGSILVFFLSGSLTRPIIKINDVAEEIAQLNFDRKVELSSKDEIGRLGRSINHISDELSQTLYELQTANSKLKKDIMKERQLEKMRRRFVSSVSHELKTPISMIKGYAEGLKFNIAKTQEDRSYYCDVIVDESNKMNKLITDLLDLSSYESGTFTIEKEHFDLARLIRETVEKYGPALQQRHVKSSINVPDTCFIFADKLRIEQVLSNFMSNAQKHVDDQGEIAVKLEASKDRVQLSFYNSGEDIDPGEIENIWTSFYKSTSKKRVHHEGTGLGLAIIRAIVELHHGHYGVRNLEEGVEFWVELPMESSQ